LSNTRTQVVQGAGSLDSDIMIVIGQPGRESDKTGDIYSQGAIGEIFEAYLDALELDRESIWITCAVKCMACDSIHGKLRNRAVTKDEMEICSEWLNLEIETVDPKIIILIGSVPLFMVTKLTGINTHRGRFISVTGKKYKVFPLISPNMMKYSNISQAAKDILIDDLDNLKKGIDKCLKRNLD